jgi:hypothetical protein
VALTGRMTELLCDRCGSEIAHGTPRYAVVGSVFGVWICDAELWQDVNDGGDELLAVYCASCHGEVTTGLR